MSDSVPTISVFMKSYNHAPFIGEAIDSVIQQDFDDLELIIIDDASTDSSRQIIERFRSRDDRIRTIFHEHNRGISKTVNDGIEAARGTFIAQIDSDDVWTTDKLRKQLAVAREREDVLVWTEGAIINGNGRPAGHTFSELVGSERKKKSGNIFHELLAGNYILGSSLLYDRQIVGGTRYDEALRYVNDYKFLLELARTYEFCYIDEPLTQYRVHEKSTIGCVFFAQTQGVHADRNARQRIRLAMRETATIGEHMLERYHDELPRATQASLYRTYGRRLEDAGDYDRALSLLVHAIRCDPLSWSAITSARGIGRLVLRSVTSRSSRG
ncbi:MAG: glycosyltransferase family 2 protein [Halobacteriota archaeon]